MKKALLKLLALSLALTFVMGVLSGCGDTAEKDKTHKKQARRKTERKSHLSDFRFQPWPGTIAITAFLAFCSWLLPCHSEVEK